MYSIVFEAIVWSLYRLRLRMYILIQTAYKDIDKYTKKIKYTLLAKANDYAGTKRSQKEVLERDSRSKT